MREINTTELKTIEVSGGYGYTELVTTLTGATIGVALTINYLSDVTLGGVSMTLPLIFSSFVLGSAAGFSLPQVVDYFNSSVETPAENKLSA